MEHVTITRALYDSACKLPEYYRREFYDALMQYLFEEKELENTSDTVAAMMALVKAAQLAKKMAGAATNGSCFSVPLPSQPMYRTDCVST